MLFFKGGLIQCVHCTEPSIPNILCWLLRTYNFRLDAPTGHQGNLPWQALYYKRFVPVLFLLAVKNKPSVFWHGLAVSLTLRQRLGAQCPLCFLIIRGSTQTLVGGAYNPTNGYAISAARWRHRCSTKLYWCLCQVIAHPLQYLLQRLNYQTSNLYNGHLIPEKAPQCRAFLSDKAFGSERSGPDSVSLPSSKLKSLLDACITLRNLQTMRNLQGTHLGHNVISYLCRILEDRSVSSCWNQRLLLAAVHSAVECVLSLCTNSLRQGPC